MRKCQDMPYHIGIVVRIYPNTKQKRLISINAGASRFVYNRLVSLERERHDLLKCAANVPAYQERIAYIEGILFGDKTGKNATQRMCNLAPFLYEKDVDFGAADTAIRNHNKAWEKFREDPHAGIPQYKKKGYELSYQTNGHYYNNAICIDNANVRFDDKTHLTLPKLGRIRMSGSKERIDRLIHRPDTRIGTITVSKDAVDRYYVSLSISGESPFYEQLPFTASAVGIDLNIENFLWDSNDVRVDNPRFRHALQEKLAEAQRSMSRKAQRAKKENRALRDSQNYQKDRRRVAYLQAKIASQGENFRNVVSKQYVKNHDIIVAEDLKVRNLLKNHRLAMSISEVGWGDFIRKLEYKANIHGRLFIQVPPHHTTQTCGDCGHVLTGDEKLTLSDREWVCPACGVYHVRDHNAAKVILARGLATLLA